MWRIIWLVLWITSAVCDGYQCYRKIKTNDTCKGEIRKTTNNSTSCCRLPQAKGFFAVKVVLGKNLYRCIPCGSVPVNGHWAEWSTWTSCNASCEGGTQSRTRGCGDGHNCPGEASQARVCQSDQCENMLADEALALVNGNWGQWSSWTECALNCGVVQRTRSCDGGDNCSGSNRETKNCHGTTSAALCPGNDGWGEWSKWRKCSSTCGVDGMTYRTRHCVNPLPSNGKSFCPGDRIETSHCRSPACPINGSWGQWSNWTECAVNCGVVQRTRSCDSPRARFGGNDCSGHRKETKKCQGTSSTDLCPVDGGWAEWSSWDRCLSKEVCGSGWQYRTRNCTNPEPHSGQDCKGKAYDVRHCRESLLCDFFKFKSNV